MIISILLYFIHLQNEDGDEILMKKKRNKSFTHHPKNSDGQIENHIFFEVRLINNLFEIGFHFSTVDDVVEEISIPEKIATLERCDEIATTERYHEETLENGKKI